MMEDVEGKEMHSMGGTREGEKGQSQRGREAGESRVLASLSGQDVAVGNTSGDMSVRTWVNVSNG